MRERRWLWGWRGLEDLVGDVRGVELANFRGEEVTRFRERAGWMGIRGRGRRHEAPAGGDDTREADDEEESANEGVGGHHETWGVERVTGEGRGPGEPEETKRQRGGKKSD